MRLSQLGPQLAPPGVHAGGRTTMPRSQGALALRPANRRGRTGSEWYLGAADRPEIGRLPPDRRSTDDANSGLPSLGLSVELTLGRRIGSQTTASLSYRLENTNLTKIEVEDKAKEHDPRIRSLTLSAT